MDMMEATKLLKVAETVVHTLYVVPGSGLGCRVLAGAAGGSGTTSPGQPVPAPAPPHEK